MARGKGTTKSSEQLDYRNIVWVLNNLTKAELDEMDRLALTSDQVDEILDKLVSDGWKLSVKLDKYSGGVQSTLVNLDADNKNGGYGVSARSSRPLDAIVILAYKLAYVAEYDLSQFGREQTNVRG